MEGRVSDVAQTPQRGAADWEAWVGLSGEWRPATLAPGGTACVGVNRRVSRFLRPELVLGLGGLGSPAGVVTLLRLGTRVELPREGWAPYVSLAFAHQHEAMLATALAEPLGELLGLSEHGVVHRSGLEAAVGLSYASPPRTGEKVHGKFGLRLAWTALLGGAPRDSLHALASIGVGF